MVCTTGKAVDLSLVTGGMLCACERVLDERIEWEDWVGRDERGGLEVEVDGAVGTTGE